AQRGRGGVGNLYEFDSSRLSARRHRGRLRRRVPGPAQRLPAASALRGYCCYRTGMDGGYRTVQSVLILARLFARLAIPSRLSFDALRVYSAIRPNRNSLPKTDFILQYRQLVSHEPECVATQQKMRRRLIRINGGEHRARCFARIP